MLEVGLCPGWGKASAVLGTARDGGKETGTEQRHQGAVRGGARIRMGAASPSPAHSVPSRVWVAADGCSVGGLGHPRGLELPGEGAAALLMEKKLLKEDAAGSPGNFSSWEEVRDSRGGKPKQPAFPYISLGNFSVWVHRGLASPAGDPTCLAAPGESQQLPDRLGVSPTPVPA